MRSHLVDHTRSLERLWSDDSAGRRSPRFRSQVLATAILACTCSLAGCSMCVGPGYFPAARMYNPHWHRAHLAHPRHARQRATGFPDELFGGEPGSRSSESDMVVQFDDPPITIESLPPEPSRDGNSPTPATRSSAAPDLLNAPTESSPFESDELPPTDADAPTTYELMPSDSQTDSGARGVTVGRSQLTGTDSQLELAPPLVGPVHEEPPAHSELVLHDPSQAVSVASAAEPIERDENHGVAFAIPTRPIDAESGFETAASWQVAEPDASAGRPTESAQPSALTLDAPLNSPVALGSPVGVPRSAPMASGASRRSAPSRSSGYTILMDDLPTHEDPFEDPFGDRYDDN